MLFRIIVYLAFLGAVFSKARADNYNLAAEKVVEAFSKRYGKDIEKEGRRILRETGVSIDTYEKLGAVGGIMSDAAFGIIRSRTVVDDYKIVIEILVPQEKVSIDFKTEF